MHDGGMQPKWLHHEWQTLPLVSRLYVQTALTWPFPQTADKCKAEGAAHVETHAADLTDAAGREALMADLLKRHSVIDVLVNNAGMGVKGTPLEGGDPKRSRPTSMIEDAIMMTNDGQIAG